MVSHPYYPLDVKLPHYVPNEKSFVALNAIILGWGLGIIVVANYVIAFLWPTTSRRERYTSVWFVMCGFLHITFEGKVYQKISGRDLVEE
jgi:cholestenol delta-isomerase